jgi:hypothetical protein
VTFAGNVFPVMISCPFGSAARTEKTGLNLFQLLDVEK